MGAIPLVSKLGNNISNFQARLGLMRSPSVSLTAILFFRFRTTIGVAALMLVIALPLFERRGNGQQILTTPVDSQSTAVVIRTPEQVLTRPLRSIANVVRGEQSIRTQNGIGYRVVNVRAQDEIWLVSARQQKPTRFHLEPER